MRTIALELSDVPGGTRVTPNGRFSSTASDLRPEEFTQVPKLDICGHARSLRLARLPRRLHAICMMEDRHKWHAFEVAPSLISVSRDNPNCRAEWLLAGDCEHLGGVPPGLVFPTPSMPRRFGTLSAKGEAQARLGLPTESDRIAGHNSWKQSRRFERRLLMSRKHESLLLVRSRAGLPLEQ